MLLALTFVNFQVQMISALEFILEWLMRIPVAGDHIASMLSGENSETHIATSDFNSFVLSSWAVLSLVFMLAGMIANYYAAPQNFNGEVSAWMLNFSLISLLLFVVSAYCLSISHFLGYLNDALMADELNASDDPRGIQ